MKFRVAIKTITIVIEAILALILLMVFAAFALRPTELSLFTNSLILVMIMVQLHIATVLLDIYEKIGVKK